MKIENVPDMKAARARYEQTDAAGLIGQQVALRGAIHSIEWLATHQADGVTPQMMLESLRTQLFELHEVAHARGIALPSYR